MRLTKITIISAELELRTGLHIGAGDGMMQIGGVDKEIIRHPLTREPYIPGSSLKGKIRSLLEWRSGAVQEKALGRHQLEKPGVLPILQLFGISGSDFSDLDAAEAQKVAQKVGPARLAFWDCPLSKASRERMREANVPLTEVKSENSINRISGTADNPRFIERVPAGMSFDFRLSFKRLDGDGSEELLNMVLAGLKLLEWDSLGGSGSRGYGKVRFVALKEDDKDIAADFGKLEPFGEQGRPC